MKFVIVSDTHGNVKNFKKVINWVNNNNINLILHCGDIGDPASLQESLEDFKGKFFGVLGNMDSIYSNRLEIYNSINNVKIESKILEIPIDNKMIAITHYPERAKTLAESGKYDIVFYGHTHKPWEEKVPVKENSRQSRIACRLVNPGETAGQLYKPCFAVYDVKKDFLELKILERLE